MNCSNEIEFISMQVHLDNYIKLNWTVSNRIDCLEDTVVDEAQETQIVYSYEDSLYRKYQRIDTSQYIYVNGSNFRDVKNGEQAYCQVTREHEVRNYTNWIESVIAYLPVISDLVGH